MPAQPDTPTRGGQVAIIKNLQSIFTAIMGLALAALFGWGQSLSRDVNDNHVVIQELKDKIDGLNKKIDNQITSVYKDIHDNEDDIKDLQIKTESDHDDSKIKIKGLEDWQLFHNK